MDPSENGSESEHSVPFLQEGIDYELVDVEETLVLNPESSDQQKLQRKRKKTEVVQLADLPRTPDQKKISFRAVFVARNFKGQKHGENVGDLLITGDTTTDIARELWDFVSKFIRREVFFAYPQSEASSSTDLELFIKESDPNFEDIDKFLLCSDKISKRYYGPSSLLSNILHSWYNKDVNVFIYRYSIAVTSAQQWEKVKAKQTKPAESDRAGAPSNVTLAEMVAALKETHKDHYISDYINWSIWATYILKQPEHVRAKLIASAPPNMMIRLFRPVPLHPDTILEKTNQELRIAGNVIDFFDDELKDLRTCNENLKALTLQIDGRISAMEKKVSE